MESINNAAANFGTAEITAALEKDIIIKKIRKLTI